MARVEIERIAFKGVGLALNDVMAGRVQMMFSTPSSSLQYVRAGRLRGLATTGAEPSPVGIVLAGWSPDRSDRMGGSVSPGPTSPSLNGPNWRLWPEP